MANITIKLNETLTFCMFFYRFGEGRSKRRMLSRLCCHYIKEIEEIKRKNIPGVYLDLYLLIWEQ